MSHYHTILGIQAGASKDEIKTAFRKLSKKYHPDLNPSPNAKVQFIRIHEAYKFLTSRNSTANKYTSSFQQQQYAAKKAYYERKKEAAKAYAAKKAREAYRNERKYVQLFLTSFRWISYPIIAINLILAIDFVLFPLSSKKEEIIHVSQNRRNLTYLDIRLETQIVTIEAHDLKYLANAKYATIQKTMILGFLKGLEINNFDQEIVIYEPTGRYILFRIVAPVITLVLLLVYFYIEFEDFLLSSYIIVILMSFFEFIVYFGNP